MRTLFENRICRILLVEGHLGALGQKRVIGTTRIAGRLIRVASNYDYIRFRDVDTGKDVVVRSLTTYDNCDSYLAPGTPGRFVLFDSRDKHAGPGAVLAVATDGQDVDDVDHMLEHLSAGLSASRRQSWRLVGLSVPALIFPPASLCVLGVGIWSLIIVGRIKRLMAEVPDRALLLSLAASPGDAAAGAAVPMGT